MYFKQPLLLILIIFLLGCESSFIDVLSDEEVEQVLQIIEEENNSYINNIAILKDNNIYLMKDADKASLIKLTNDSNSLRKNVKISYDNQKILYFEKNLGVVIIDTTGEILDVADEILNAEQIDWLPNDQGIYYLYNSKLNVYGNDIELPSLSSNVYSPNKKVISAAVSINGDVAYIIDYNSSYGQGNTLYVKVNDEDKTIFESAGNPDYPAELAYVNFSSDGNSIILGYQDDYYDPYPVKVEIYDELVAESPIKSYENPYGIATPCYNSDLNAFASGYAISSDGEIGLTFINLNDSDKSFSYDDIIITELDWK